MSGDKDFKIYIVGLLLFTLVPAFTSAASISETQKTSSFSSVIAQVFRWCVSWTFYITSFIITFCIINLLWTNIIALHSIKTLRRQVTAYSLSPDNHEAKIVDNYFFLYMRAYKSHIEACNMNLNFLPQMVGFIDNLTLFLQNYPGLSSPFKQILETILHKSAVLKTPLHEHQLRRCLSDIYNTIQTTMKALFFEAAACLCKISQREEKLQKNTLLYDRIYGWANIIFNYDVGKPNGLSVVMMTKRCNTPDFILNEQSFQFLIHFATYVIAKHIQEIIDIYVSIYTHNPPHTIQFYKSNFRHNIDPKVVPEEYYTFITKLNAALRLENSQARSALESIATELQKKANGLYMDIVGE